MMLSLPAAVRAAECPQHFAGGVVPALLNPRLAPGSRLLCFAGFAVLHSAATRTPLYAAEHLTAASVTAARSTPRESEFHAEPRLPQHERADLADYARSGFDRGHMAPSGDMPGADAQYESFSLANIVPQSPRLNRGMWEGIESDIRSLAVESGALYVVTGPVFQGAALATVGRVGLPTHLFKAVLDPRRRLAAAYVVPNADDGVARVVSIGRLAALTGLVVFPGAPPRRLFGMLRLPDAGLAGYARMRPHRRTP